MLYAVSLTTALTGSNSAVESIVVVDAAALSVDEGGVGFWW